jgi:4-hydroxy-tetrahydrodipicolinate synthase
MHPLSGIYVASITPFNNADELELDSIPGLLNYYADQGAQGALLAGTTGEGTSLSDEERLALFRQGIKIREHFPDFRVLASTGTPSLTQTITLTQQAFDIGCEAVLVLPPFYLRSAPLEGIYQWYAQVLERAVPKNKYLLAYHIPQISGINMPVELFSRLDQAFPNRFAGIKDSTGDLEHAKSAAKALTGKAVLVGNDHLIGPSLAAGSSGAITALANLKVASARKIWDSFGAGENFESEQASLSQARKVLDQHPPAPAFLKALLPNQSELPKWSVRLPLLPFDKSTEQSFRRQYEASLDG